MYSLLFKRISKVVLLLSPAGNFARVLLTVYTFGTKSLKLKTGKYVFPKLDEYPTPNIPKNFALYHAWYYNAKPNLMANNGLKFLRIDAQARERGRSQWNQPILWPLGVLLLLLAAVLLPAFLAYRRKVHAAPQDRSTR